MGRKRGHQAVRVQPKYKYQNSKSQVEAKRYKQHDLVGNDSGLSAKTYCVRRRMPLLRLPKLDIPQSFISFHSSSQW